MTNGARAAVVLGAAIAGGLLSACGAKAVRQPAAPLSHDQVVLIADADTGTVGRARVGNSAGSVDLTTERTGTIVRPNQTPATPVVLSDAEIARVFGGVLATLPPPPMHFTLYFRFESDELTDESRELVGRILQSVKGHPAPDVVVVGHTDTTGTPAGNVELGLKRAHMVRALLVAAGLDPTFVGVASHGEADLLVSTADDVFEPRNRRVDITVR